MLFVMVCILSCFSNCTSVNHFLASTPLPLPYTSSGLLPHPPCLWSSGVMICFFYVLIFVFFFYLNCGKMYILFLLRPGLVSSGLYECLGSTLLFSQYSLILFYGTWLLLFFTNIFAVSVLAVVLGIWACFSCHRGHGGCQWISSHGCDSSQSSPSRLRKSVWFSHDHPPWSSWDLFPSLWDAVCVFSLSSTSTPHFIIYFYLLFYYLLLPP